MGRRIGVLFFEEGHGHSLDVLDSLAELGHEVHSLPFDHKLPAGLELIFVIGPFGSLAPLARQLAALPSAERPRLLWWLTEQLPNPAWPFAVTRKMALARSAAEWRAYKPGADGRWRAVGSRRWLTRKGLRLRYLGDMLRLQEAGLLSLLVVGSTGNAAYLRSHGLELTSPSAPSYRKEWGQDLGLERDIPVLWLGKTATRRRRRNLERLRRDLAQRDIPLRVIDGKEAPYVFGPERTRLLNRTRIVLNLLRTEWDTHAGRFYLAASNCALVVSEPCRNRAPGFQPGVHYVEAPLPELAATIERYLDHPDLAQPLVDSAYDLLMATPRREVYGLMVQRAFDAEMQRASGR